MGGRRLVLLGGCCFAVLGVVAFEMRSLLTLVAVIGASCLAAYFLAQPEQTIRERRAGPGFPSVLLILSLIFPLILAGVLLLEGSLSWNSLLLILVSYGLLVTFWTDLVSIPLAVLDRTGENGRISDETLPSMTVLVPAYNEEKVIGRTLDSILEAEYTRKQVIVIDDGSTDRTPEILRKYEDRVLVLTKENGGKSSALNYGLRHAKGEIVVVVDADTTVGVDSFRQLARNFSREEVVAVAGNVKVLNRRNWLTRCQALEYIASIQIIRRALDRFGSVTVVPGSLGAFRRRSLEEIGFYDHDTLTEDFDTTVKVLKTGLVVQASSKAVAYTQAPDTLKDLYNQRMRWYRGNFQTFFKHSDALTNPRFGFLYDIGFPFMLLSMVFAPMAGFVVWGAAIAAVVEGNYLFVLTVFLLFTLLQFFLCFLAIEMDGDDRRLLAYSPLFVVGYKQLVDAMTVKALFDVLLHRKTGWTRARRRELEPAIVARV
jgi:cellulose synthase/poly-beta-1,6-N-acetylglucosamine synthase-like glycosyltransferase